MIFIYFFLKKNCPIYSKNKFFVIILLISQPKNKVEKKLLKILKTIYQYFNTPND